MEKTITLIDGSFISDGIKEGELLISDLRGRRIYRIQGKKNIIMEEKRKGGFSIVVRDLDAGYVGKNMEMYFEGQNYSFPKIALKNFIKGKINSVEIEQNGTVVGTIRRNSGSLLANTDLMDSAILVYMALLSPYTYRTFGKMYSYGSGREEPSIWRIIAYVLIVFIAITFIFFTFAAILLP